LVDRFSRNEQLLIDDNYLLKKQCPGVDENPPGIGVVLILAKD